jgi:poly(3-hydroxyalkanoate) synthetase
MGNDRQFVENKTMILSQQNQLLKRFNLLRNVTFQIPRFWVSDILSNRAAVFSSLKRKGAEMADIPTRDYSRLLLNHYLDNIETVQSIKLSWKRTQNGFSYCHKR